MKDGTVSTAFVKMLLEGAAKQGLDCERMLLDNGISPLSLEHSERRIPLDNFAALAREIMRALDDECLGLTRKTTTVG